MGEMGFIRMRSVYDNLRCCRFDSRRTTLPRQSSVSTAPRGVDQASRDSVAADSSAPHGETRHSLQANGWIEECQASDLVSDRPPTTPRGTNHATSFWAAPLMSSVVSLPRGLVLDRLVHRGAYAEVWQARPASDAATCVAVKMLRLYPCARNHNGRIPAAWDEGEARRRFQFESELHASLYGQSRFICQAYSHGSLRDVPYLMMEWLEGDQLGVFCLRNRLTPLSRMQLFSKILLGVQFLHERSVSHRDLKPENAMILRDALGNLSPKIIDFGAAIKDEPTNSHSPASGAPDLVQGVAGGAYRSPERSAEQGSSCWRKESDIYALGVMLHELLYGFRPLQSLEPIRDSLSAELGRPLGGGHCDWIAWNQELRRSSQSPAGSGIRVPRFGRDDGERLAWARSCSFRQLESLWARQDVRDVVLGALRFNPAERPTVEVLRAQVDALVSAGRLNLRTESEFHRSARRSGGAS